MMKSSSFTLETSDGVPVHVHQWLPVEGVRPRGVVQLVHGMQEHAARYEHVAQAFTAAGYGIYAKDLRGHGRTAASEDDLLHLADDRGWARVLDDLYRLNRRIREDHPEGPVYLLGHSMGSFLTQQFLFTFPGAIDAAILSGTNGDPGLLAEVGAVLARIERRRIGKRGRSKLLNRIAFGAYNKAFQPVRTEFDWLSSDPAQVEAYVADPWCGALPTTQFWIDLLSGLRVIADPTHLQRIPKELPILVFSGEDDPVGAQTRGVQKLLDAYAAAGLTQVTHRFYPGRHELFNETNKDEVIADVIAWLDEQTAEHTRAA